MHCLFSADTGILEVKEQEHNFDKQMYNKAYILPTQISKHLDKPFAPRAGIPALRRELTWFSAGSQNVTEGMDTPGKAFTILLP